MSTATLETLNQQLQQNGLNTVEQFCQRVNDVITRHSSQSDLSGLLKEWQDGGCDVTFLQTQIRPTLLHLRRMLSQKQYRCDGDIEQLEEVRRALKDGSAAQHVLDTIYVRVFVKWCDAFPDLAREETTIVA